MTQKNIIQSLAATGVFLALLIGVALFLDAPAQDILLREGGIVELASVWGYVLCVLYIAHKGGKHYIAKYHYIVLLIIFCMLRELDFDKRLTTMGILKSKFLVSPDVPLIEKLIGAAFILLIVYCVVMTIVLHAKKFFADLKTCSSDIFGLMAIGFLLVTSKLLDGAERKMKTIGVEVGFHASHYATLVEEILELGIPIVILICLKYYFNKSAEQGT